MATQKLKSVFGRDSLNLLRETPAWRAARHLRNRLRYLRVRADVRRLWGEPGLRLRPDEATVVCLLRDAEYYLKAFLRHYTELGVRQIILLDNGSSDRTLALAREHEHVTILQSRLPYSRYQYLFKEYLLRTYGVGGWRILVDCDELLDYPRSAAVPLPELLRYLNAHGYNTVVSQLLDMFDERLPAGPSGAIDHDLRARYPYYDLSNLTSIDYEQYFPENRAGSPAVKMLRGGIRQTLFGTVNWLTKHTLVRLDRQIELKWNTAHDLYRASAADVTAVLYHYKFTEHFAEQTERAVREENYAIRSHEYKRYHQVLTAERSLQLRQPTSRRLAGTDELVREGFLVASPTYSSFADALEQAALAR